VIATLWLPGALLLPWLLPAWWRRLRRRDARYVLLLGWALLVLLFFSASPGKREVYIFPMLPALCIAAAPLLPALLRRRGVRIVLLAWLCVFSAIVTFAAGAALSGQHEWGQRLAVHRAIDPASMRALLGWSLALGITGFVLVAWARMRRIPIALLLFTAMSWTVYGIGIAPALDRSSSARGLMETVSHRIGGDAELGLVAWREQVLLQTRVPTIEFGYKQPLPAQWREATAWLKAAPARRWLLLPQEALPDCIDRARAIRAGRASRREWWLLPARAVPADCVAVEDGDAASRDDG
jgi:hypothetical protein